MEPVQRSKRKDQDGGLRGRISHGVGGYPTIVRG